MKQKTFNSINFKFLYLSLLTFILIANTSHELYANHLNAVLHGNFIEKSTLTDSIKIGSGKFENIIVLPAPDRHDQPTEREIILPDFEAYCHVAADSPSFRWIGASNRMFPWVGGNDLTSIFEPKSPIPPRIPMPNKRSILTLFKLSNGEYLSIMPLSGDASVSWLETLEDGKLIVDYGSLGVEPVPNNTPVPLLAWAISDNVYGAIAKIWEHITENELYKDKASLRVDKSYPEAMKYLGWCSWEQYHRGINEEVVTNVFKRIENSNIPVRWILLDDGHQARKDNPRQMVSMKPDAEKFPNGWEPIIALKKEDKVKWIGIWHTLLMHWGNVDPNHEMTNLAPYLMPQPDKMIKEFPKDNQYIKDPVADVKSLIVNDNQEDSEKFYMEFMKTVKNDGFDFIKTDNVSRSVIEYYGTANAARAHKFNVISLEHACNENGLGLMNCSAQNTIGMLNATYSATMRTSPDYQKHNLPTSKSQILQSVFNVSWLGQTLWPDHDMFHSSDLEVGETMSLTKAMSGGPIYLSDAPSDFNMEVITPLCYNDGLLIRPLAPAAPMPESFFNDALYEKKDLYKVIAPLNNKSCAIATYNLTLDKNAELSAKITPDDYRYAPIMMQPYDGLWESPKEGIVIYNWKEKKGSKLENDGFHVNIKGFGHKLFLLCPIDKGWAVVGRPDKFLSPSTIQILEITEKSISIKMIEQGAIILYSERGGLKSDSMEFISLGDDFYRGEIKGSVPNNDIITITN
ncbi:Sip1-related alpha-galactosidase [Portibacter lacus]|uniref:Glycoside hydrolase family 36 n=1 Tax=Portibacter lacus TaxID=1099794 RepID=A0AA37WFL4_9BACT|nr:Sip1-related alpha-galactosidase [Portibacter lacus]GLR20201.1 glycoside hydrolase family 36 [Portibacter lacus]